MNYYSIVFNTTTGSRRSMRIKNPVTGLPLNEIEAAVGQMIANDIFDQQRGGLDSLNRMELTIVERTHVERTQVL
ncbi:MAG: DUF2922 domain-containing protein [Defluviitaleaceae bacterium]|nr:DUF2922 domain-containing protein [Defluviitaleaceae bacterium]